MNYESGIFHFKGQRRMSSFFIFHLSGRTDQLVDSYRFRMTSGFYYRAHRTHLQEIVLTVGADGGRTCTEYHAVLVSYQSRMAVGKKTKGRARPPGAPHGGMALLFSRLGVRADGSASRPYPDE